MPYDEDLAKRVRMVLESQPGVTEKKMFGGLAFMVRGHMAVGITGDELMVRVGPSGWEEALSRSGVREMDFTGRSLKGFVYVGPAALARDEDLAEWVGRAIRFVDTLPQR
jgi:TfoX/Sxy family transcriptional regulator of competence genes